MGTIGTLCVLLIAFVLVMLMFPKMSNFYDKFVAHFDIEETEPEPDETIEDKEK